MYITIDPSEKDKIRIIGFTEDRVETEIFTESNKKILMSVDSFLSARGLTAHDVRGIATVVGVGGFTSTRIATTVANVWHFVYKIPVFGVSSEEAVEPQKLMERFKNPQKKNYIFARYGGEPNIGK